MTVWGSNKIRSRMGKFRVNHKQFFFKHPMLPNLEIKEILFKLRKKKETGRDISKVCTWSRLDDE